MGEANLSAQVYFNTSSEVTERFVVFRAVCTLRCTLLLFLCWCCGSVMYLGY